MPIIKPKRLSLSPDRSRRVRGAGMDGLLVLRDKPFPLGAPCVAITSNRTHTRGERGSTHTPLHRTRELDQQHG